MKLVRDKNLSLAKVQADKKRLAAFKEIKE